MDERLYIEGVLCSLGKSSITRNLRQSDVADLSRSKSSFSYKIKLPKDDINKDIFKNLGMMGNNSGVPYTKLEIRYVVNGIALIPKGFFVVTSTTNFYEGNIVSGVISLSEILANKNVKDLDLSEYDHVYNAPNVIDTFENTEGYIYAFANTGIGESTRLRFDYIPPSIFLSTIFFKILEESGITLSGSMFSSVLTQRDSSFYEEVVAPYFGNLIDLESGLSSKSQIASYGREVTVVSENDPEEEVLLLYNTDFENNGFVDRQGNIGLTIEIVSDGYYFFEASTHFVDRDGIAATFDVAYMRPIISVDGDDEFFSNGDENTLDGYQFYKAYLRAGQQVRISYMVFKNYTIESNVFDLDINVYRYTPSQLIEVGNSLPDIAQLDFIKDVFERYGWILQPDNTDETRYTVLSLESVLNLGGTEEDWTDKLVSITGETYNSGYSKDNVFRYNYDEGAVNIDGNLYINDENLPFQQDVHTSLNNIPIINDRFLGSSLERNFEMVTLNLFEFEDVDDDVVSIDIVPSTLDNGDLEIEEIETENETGFYIRVDALPDVGFVRIGNGSALQLNQRLTGDELVQLRYTGSASTESVGTFEYVVFYDRSVIRNEDAYRFMKIRRGGNDGYVYNSVVFFDEDFEGVSNVPFLSLDNVDFGYYIERNYKNFGNMISKYKKISAVVNLDLIDINFLRYDRLKFLKQTGRYYYLNSLRNKIGSLSKAELIEIR